MSSEAVGDSLAVLDVEPVFPYTTTAVLLRIFVCQLVRDRQQCTSLLILDLEDVAAAAVPYRQPLFVGLRVQQCHTERRVLEHQHTALPSGNCAKATCGARTPGRILFFPAWPGLYVCKGSTLFTKMLGFTARRSPV